MSRNKILYAEDDETLAFLTKDSLEAQGLRCVPLSDGNACLDAFRKGSFDLCILDIMLLGMDGFSGGSHQEYEPGHSGDFLSAKTLKEDRLRGLRIGADDYLVKPFNMEELVLKIESFFPVPKNRACRKKTYRAGSYSFDRIISCCSAERKQIILTQKEAALLQFCWIIKQSLKGNRSSRPYGDRMIFFSAGAWMYSFQDFGKYFPLTDS